MQVHLLLLQLLEYIPENMFYLELVQSYHVSAHECRNVLVPKCLGAEVSGQFDTSAEVSSGP